MIRLSVYKQTGFVRLATALTPQLNELLGTRVVQWRFDYEGSRSKQPAKPLRCKETWSTPINMFAFP